MQNKNSTDLTMDDVVRLLKDAIAQSGSARAWASQNKVSEPYLSDVAWHRRDPGPKILEALGLEKVVRYRRIVADEN